MESKFPPLPPDQRATYFFFDDDTRTSGLCFLDGDELNGVPFKTRAEFQGAMEQVMRQAGIEPAPNQVPLLDELDMRGMLDSGDG